MSNREPGKTDILQGTLDIMVLQTLTTLGPVHGYAIATRLTAAGRRELTAEKAEWERTASIMHALLNGPQ
jgi:DNA-binding PadR family transcriptional regulator